MSNFYKLFGPLFLGASLIASNFGTADARTVEFNACHPNAVKVGTTTVRAVGMHNISPSGYFTHFSATSSMNSMFAGVQGDGVYYEFKSNNATNPTMTQMQKWNTPAYTRNGSLITVPNNVACLPVAIAYNPVDKLLYGCFYTADKKGWELGSITPDQFNSNFKRPVIATLAKKWDAIAFTAEGKAYIIDIDGKLGTVNLNDGTITEIGSTGLVPTKSGSMTYDDFDGTLYWAVVTSDGSYICSVNPANAATKKILTLPYGEQLHGISIFTPAVNAKAPAYADNLKFTFEGTRTEGKASFTMPSTLFDGTKAEGEADYKVIIQGKQVAAGKAAYGAAVEVPVTSHTEGRLLAEVIVSNTAGNGPSNKIEINVGNGTPVAPSKVTATYADGKFHVQWPAVTASADGCFFDPAAVTYKVVRQPDGVTVAESVKDLSLDDEVAAPERIKTYYYEVTAIHAGKSSAPTASAKVTLGTLLPPYEENFTDDNMIAEYTILNSNNDGNTWMKISNGGMVIPASKTVVMNDWLITPAITLKGGEVYMMTLAMDAMYSNVNESFEVKMGQTATASGLKTAVLAKTNITADAAPIVMMLKPTADGKYYIGIHATSAKNSGALYVRNLKIDAGLSANAPQSVTDLKAVPASDGSTKVTVSFTAPTKALNGTDLTSLDKIEIYRGETLVNTFEAPEKGAALSFRDNPGKSGNVTYSVTAFNSDGKGLSAFVTCHAGVNLPAAPKNVKVALGAAEGMVKITWDTPTADVAGNPVDASLISFNLYTVVNGKRESVATGIKANEYTHKACEPGEAQRFVQYGVMAVTAKGEGPGAASALLPVGKRYTLPFNESVAYGSLSHIFGTDVISGTAEVSYWQQTTSGEINKNYIAADGDNGMFAHYAKYQGQGARIFTGRISLEATSPMLWFSTYCIGDNHKGELTVVIREETETEWHKLSGYIINQAVPTPKTWGRLAIDLSEWKGKNVQIGFEGKTSGFTWILLDDIRIFDAPAQDLAIASFKAPRITESGAGYTADVLVENSGKDETGAYKVALYLDDKEMASADGTALTSGKGNSHKLSFDYPVNAPQTANVTAKITASFDKVEANNVSEKAEVNVLRGSLPGVENLEAIQTNDGISVSWSAPANLSGTPASAEDFESMESWSVKGSEGWTFIDNDGKGVVGITGLELPCVKAGDKLGWWVMDNTFDKVADEIDFRPYSGSKFLASMAVTDAPNADDWAVSPLLSGKLQTVGLWAKTFHGRFPESFEMLYSTTGNAVADFKSLAKVDKVPYAWTEYSFTLPEGAKYFAIRHTTSRGFMLYIDRVTFTPASGSEKALQLQGYHVVADGKQLTESPVSATSYQLTAPASRIEVYPVYDLGTGAKAETSPKSGIEDSMASALTISAVDGGIEINGATGLTVEIFAVNGMKIASLKDVDHTVIPVESGIYLVKAGTNVCKVVVK